tara:strand:+ start:34 stop:414 length:381 start_codon:yes stop_codon:yes gene_type:complete
MTELINVSIGELLDKYTILLIKTEKITDKNKLEFVNNELELLYNNMKKYDFEKNNLFIELKNINNNLWNIEDNIRKKELNNEFDEEFIQLARNVYFTNDKRSDIKREINKLFRSNIYEVKSYEKYK